MLATITSRYDRTALLFVAAACVAILLFMFGCAEHVVPNPQITAVAQITADIGTHAANANSHTDAATTAVRSATAIAQGIPSAAPVLPPLGTASTELAAVKAEVTVIQSQVANLAGQVTTLATTVNTLTTQNTDLTADNKKLTAQWNAAWLGGRAWFWIWWIVGISSAIFIGLFIMEFALGMNIHPLSWAISAIPYIVSFFGVVGKAISGAASSLVSAIKGLFVKKPAPPPATPAAK